MAEIHQLTAADRARGRQVASIRRRARLQLRCDLKSGRITIADAMLLQEAMGMPIGDLVGLALKTGPGPLRDYQPDDHRHRPEPARKFAARLLQPLRVDPRRTLVELTPAMRYRIASDVLHHPYCVFQRRRAHEVALEGLRVLADLEVDRRAA